MSRNKSTFKSPMLGYQIGLLKLQRTFQVAGCHLCGGGPGAEWSNREMLGKGTPWCLGRCCLGILDFVGRRRKRPPFDPLWNQWECYPDLFTPKHHLFFQSWWHIRLSVLVDHPRHPSVHKYTFKHIIKPMLFLGYPPPDHTLFN